MAYFVTFPLYVSIVDSEFVDLVWLSGLIVRDLTAPIKISNSVKMNRTIGLKNFFRYSDIGNGGRQKINAKAKKIMKTVDICKSLNLGFVF